MALKWMSTMLITTADQLKAVFLGPLGINQGTYEGSGMVMKFSDNKGKIIPLFTSILIMCTISNMKRSRILSVS